MLSTLLEKWQHIIAAWQSDNLLFLIEFFATSVVALCTIITFIAVLNNFFDSKSEDKVSKEKKSIVETGSMTLFFVPFYQILKSKIGVIQEIDIYLKLTFILLGTIIVIIGCIVNVIGRLNLGGNWGNQIRIYNDHNLVTIGVYHLVRHPLYASLIWMFYGASLVYMNIIAFLANTLIFFPFMYYRARQEEEMLIKVFPEYKTYKQKTGMFFPWFLIKN